MVAAGFYYSYFLLENGTVFSVGQNNFGQLGVGDIVDRSTVQAIQSLFGITIVSVTSRYHANHGLFISNTSQVYATGYNARGQLGIGDTTNQNSPIRIASLNSISMVAAGDAHSLFLTKSNQLYACGMGSYGQLGTGLVADSLIPTLIPTGSTIISSISAGYGISYYLASSGVCYATGLNSYMQQGTIGYNGSLSTFTPIGSTYQAPVSSVVPGGETPIWSLFVTPSRLFYHGDIALHISSTQTYFGSTNTKIAAGTGLSFVWTDANHLVGLGYEQQGQLGLGNTKIFHPMLSLSLEDHIKL
jgi:alpha-tubulin suppressor-like RCC1 family protein